MKGQDIVILVWIASEETSGNKDWVIRDLAHDLNISTSTVHSSLSSMETAGLYDKNSKRISKQTLLDFLKYGFSIVFPIVYGAETRGIIVPLKVIGEEMNLSSEKYIWKNSKGKDILPQITPLYNGAPIATLKSKKAKEIIGLLECLRMTRHKRMTKIAFHKLEEMIMPNSSNPMLALKQKHE
ncbi:hypothetical protein ERX46_02825 [Brumimicrobium glaciale]|uniref:Uncharacterized protein n=1 Tax=Brumimicrobium glaciale TaxID=200475 RepID=A0A4Q4KSC3_9FLAO|nr:hypothetical protein [Brumimicrobium glaciale]RYM35945.1 hypothetical protein ERX46_02825 [Brumimicrobium glaciale]